MKTPCISESAYTLFELLVTVAFLGVLIGMAYPNIVGLSQSKYELMARQQFEFSVMRARAEALANGTRVVFQTNTDGSVYKFGTDKLPFNDPASYDQLIFSDSFKGDVKLTLNDTLIFNSRGYVVDQDDQLNSVSVTLKRKGKTFCTGTIYATGFLDYSCNF